MAKVDHRLSNVCLEITFWTLEEPKAGAIYSTANQSTCFLHNEAQIGNLTQEFNDRGDFGENVRKLFILSLV